MIVSIRFVKKKVRMYKVRMLKFVSQVIRIEKGS